MGTTMKAGTPAIDIGIAAGDAARAGGEATADLLIQRMQHDKAAWMLRSRLEQ